MAHCIITIMLKADSEIWTQISNPSDINTVRIKGHLSSTMMQIRHTFQHTLTNTMSLD